MSVAGILSLCALFVFCLLQMVETQGSTRNAVNYQHIINRSVFYNDSVLLSLETMFPRLDKELKYDPSVNETDQVFQQKTRFVKLNHTWDMDLLGNCYGILKKNETTFFTICFEKATQGDFLLQIAEVTFYISSGHKFQKFNLKKYIRPEELVVEFTWNTRAESLYLMLQRGVEQTGYDKVSARNMSLLVVDLRGGLQKVVQVNFTLCSSDSTDFLPNFDLFIQYAPATTTSSIQTSLILLSDYGIADSFRLLTFVHKFNDSGTTAVEILHEMYSPFHYPGDEAQRFNNCTGVQQFENREVEIPTNCSVKAFVPTTWTLLVVCVNVSVQQPSTSVMSFIPCSFSDSWEIQCSPSSRKNMSTYTDKFRSEDRDYTPIQISGYFVPIDPRDLPNIELREKESQLYMITQEALFRTSVSLNTSGEYEFEHKQVRNFTLEKRYSFAMPVLLHPDRKGNLVTIVESKSGFRYPMVTNFEKNTTRVYKEKIMSEIVEFFYDTIEHTPFLVGASIPMKKEDIFKFPGPVFYRDYEQEILIAFFNESKKQPIEEPRYIRGRLSTDDLQTVLDYQFVVYPSFDYVPGNSLQSFENCRIYGYQLEQAIKTGLPINLPYEHREMSGNGFRYSGQAYIDRDNTTLVTVRDETIKRIFPQQAIDYLNLTRKVVMFEKYILCLVGNFFVLVEPLAARESLGMKVLSDFSRTAFLNATDDILDFVAFRLYPNSFENDTVIMVLIWSSTDKIVDKTTGENITTRNTKAGLYTVSKKKVKLIHSAKWNQAVTKVDIVAFGLQIDVIGIVEGLHNSDGGRFMFQFSGPLFDPNQSPFPPELMWEKSLNPSNSEVLDFHRETYLGSLNIYRLLLDDPENLPNIETFSIYRQIINFNGTLSFEFLDEIRTSVYKYTFVTMAEEIVIFKDLRRNVLIAKTVVLDSQIGPWILTYVLPSPSFDLLLYSNIYGKILYLTFEPDLLIIYDISSQGSINMLKRVIGEHKLGFPLVEYLPDGSIDESYFVEYVNFAAITTNKLDSSATSTGLYMATLKKKYPENKDSGSQALIVNSDFLLMDTHRPKIVLEVTSTSKSGETSKNLSNSHLKCSAYLELKMETPSFLINQSNPDANSLSQYIKITISDFNSRLVAKVHQQYKPKPEVSSAMERSSSRSVGFDLTELIGTTSHVLRYRLIQPADSDVFSVSQTLKMLPSDNPVYSTLPILPLAAEDCIDISDNFTIVMRPDRVDITERKLLISETAFNLTTTIKFEQPYQYTILKYPSESVPYWAILTCQRLNFAQTQVEILLISRTNPRIYARTRYTADMTIQQAASLGVIIGSNTSQVLLVVCQNTTSSLMTTLHFATFKLTIRNYTAGLKSGIFVAKCDTKALTYDLEYELANTKFFYLEGELIMVSVIKYSAYVVGLFIEINEEFIISIKEPILTRLDSMSNTATSNLSVLVDEKNLDIKILSMHETDQTALMIHSVRFSLDLEDDKRFYSKLEHTLPWPKDYSHMGKFRHSNELLLVRTASPEGYMFYFVYSLQEKRIVGSLTHEDIPNCTPLDFNQAKLFMLRAQRAVYVMIPGRMTHYVFQFDFPKLWVNKQETFWYSQISEYKLVMEGLQHGNQAEFPITSIISLDVVGGWGRWTPFIWAGIVVMVIGMAVFLVYYRIQANKRMKKERKPKKSSPASKSPTKTERSPVKSSLFMSQIQEPSILDPPSYDKSFDASTLLTSSNHL